MEYVVYKISAVLRGIKSTGYVQQIALVYRLSTARHYRDRLGRGGSSDPSRIITIIRTLILGWVLGQFWPLLSGI